MNARTRAAPPRAPVHGGAAARDERLEPRDHRVAGEAPPRVREIGRRAAVEAAELEHACAPAPPRRRPLLPPARAAAAAAPRQQSSSRAQSGPRCASKRSRFTAMQYEERTRIATPEGVELELVLAGLASRFIAEVLDSLLILVLVGLLVAVAALAGGAAGLVIGTVALGGLLLIVVAYNVAFEVLAAGRTPGKRANGAARRDGAGRAGRAARERRAQPHTPARGPGDVLRARDRLDPRHAPQPAAGRPRRRHARRPRARARAAAPPARRHDPAARAGGPHLRLGEWDVSAITQEDLATVRTFLARRDGFTPDARRGLARELADRMGAKIAGHPAGLSPEQLLEGIAEVKSARS